MKLKQAAITLLIRTEMEEKFVDSQQYRSVLSALTSFLFNLLYAIYYFILGIINCSLWFIVMCAFYGILATTRFAVILSERKSSHLSGDETQRFVMKLSGILISVLSLVLAVVIYLSLSQNTATKYGEIVMITIATYTFYKITISAIKAKKQRKNPSLLLKTIRSISYAEVAASLLTLQRSMLASFGTMKWEMTRLMNATTGAVVCLFILLLGISMVIKSK